MKHLVRLDIIENVCYDDLPSNSTLLLETDDLNNLTNRIQASFEEYIKTLGYKDVEDAKEEGVYFGNSEGFCCIPKKLQEKYGFRFVKEDISLTADFDNGFNC